MIEIIDSNLKILPYTQLNFPDGEGFVKLEIKEKSTVDILWKYENDQELITLGFLYNIINNNGGRVNNLYIPYFPHARQDRNTTIDQPFSLMVFVDILKNMVYGTKIYCLDAHSPVLLNLIGRDTLTNIESFELTQYFDLKHIDCLICPDKGAIDRVEKWSKKLKLPILYCEKTRDPSTGRLSNPVIVNRENLNKRWFYLIVDDIGTGFGTHIQLANYVKNQLGIDIKDPLSPIEIYVSHAGFSNGVEPVINVFNRVYTTNSLSRGYNKILAFQEGLINRDTIHVTMVENIVKNLIHYNP